MARLPVAVKQKRIVKSQKLSGLWKKCVNEARQVARLLRLRPEHRMKIAMIAYRACEKSYGGRPHLEQLTVSKFAREIDLHPKSVLEWMRIYRNVAQKLTPSLREQLDTSPWEATRAVAQNVKPDDDSAHVCKMFEEEHAKPQDHKKFKKYLAHVRSVLYNAKNPRRTADVPDNMLKEMIELCRTIVQLFELELKFRSEWQGKKGRLSPTKKISSKEIWEEVEGEALRKDTESFLAGTFTELANNPHAPDAVNKLELAMDLLKNSKKKSRGKR